MNTQLCFIDQLSMRLKLIHRGSTVYLNSATDVTFNAQGDIWWSIGTLSCRLSLPYKRDNLSEFTLSVKNLSLQANIHANVN